MPRTLTSRLLRRAAATWPAAARRYHATRAALQTATTLERTYGHYRSVLRMESVARDGSAVPWYTYPAIDWLAQLDFADARVLEFGSGNSTLWWSSRAASVVAIEDDPAWHARLRPRMPGNVDYRLVDGEGSSYADAVSEGDFGVVVVDGSHRYDSARAGIERLAPGGIVILDNSDWHPNTAGFLRGAGFVQIDFIGPGPINPYPWATSVFLRADGTSLHHRDGIAVPGGIVQRSDSDAPGRP